MTATVPTAELSALPTRLPPVERRAVVPAGFRFGGIRVGIKASGRPDLALIVATGGPAAAAAVFTPNAFAAAPVRLSRANLAATSGDSRGGFGWARAVVSTSGSEQTTGRSAPPAGRAISPPTAASKRVGRKWVIASSVDPRSTGRSGIAGLK